ncbi:MAG TPA: M64 family metallopeptidase [Ignavibacteriales bacterium]|nr:M64 family metallopeptidase [Ignavibacteriales bacterium]HOL81785.1 M64 family metallopeptidase [Ignavibacteriales bacterium]HOM65843.1 M64 family metallopeptidase [Ignavibacteriales bacterium]HPD67056.1 M64 family metallopeptidase [Ignavibacteriales bacterium]HPP33921.1 M64 family metallopeptidase [Ignavibacteriales bacterium]
MLRILILLVSNILIFAQIDFDKYFFNKTMRFDYFHSGTDKTEEYYYDEIIEEPYWGGSQTNLIDKFNYGNYYVKIYDSLTNQLIYSRGYSTLFGEWQTTDEAKILKRVFNETVTFPFPKNTVKLELLSRNSKGIFETKYQQYINPNNPFITKEKKLPFDTLQVYISGNYNSKLDIVLIPEGYTKEELSQFKQDCQKFTKYLLNCSPYKENANKINVWAVLAESKESGTDMPPLGIWKNTILNSRFWTFNLERYLMIEDNKTLRNIAANVPYDQIYVIVNTPKYGGGAIYNHYAVCVRENQYEDYVFVHEFGHSFAGLGDEYYTSTVAYNEFYKLDVEPWEPNLTTLVNFESKWKNMLDKETPIPTPSTDEYKNKLGVFEGGGYSAKGIYRPKQDCTMKSKTYDNFCPVCTKSIIDLLNFYSN